MAQKKAAPKRKRPARRKPLKLNLKRGTAYPLDSIADDTCCEIHAVEVLEHFSHRQTQEVLECWVQKLRPGGWLKIAVPDFERLARAYLDKTPIDIQKAMMGDQSSALETNNALFEKKSLASMMANAGLYRIQRWRDDDVETSISFNIMGQKPSGTEWDGSKVMAVSAIARFGPGAHYECATRALDELGVSHDVRSGYSWHQQLCEGIEHAIESPDVEFILTLDYDTIFAADDVLELFYLLKRYPDLGAVAATQSMRHTNGAMLFTRWHLENGPEAEKTPKGISPVGSLFEFQRDIVRITTAHFGLTFFRAELLRNLPRPWMVARPDYETGRWGGCNVGADTAFWEQWWNAGNVTALATQVIAGHLEECVIWPGLFGNVVRQGYDEFKTHGRPSMLGICGNISEA
jgi:hypothetical protein